MKNTCLFILMLLGAKLGAQGFTMDTLLWNGPADKRLNVVILGDGYQEVEINLLQTLKLFQALYLKAAHSKNTHNTLTL